jgi:integrase/recombinase XerD
MPARDPSRVKVDGPLAPHAAGFRALLAGRGYASSTMVHQMRCMGHLSRWLAARGLAGTDLTPQILEEFLASWLRPSRGLHWAHAPARLVEAYLRDLRVVVPAVVPARTDRQQLLECHCAYLAGERGLAAATVKRHRSDVGTFIATLADPVMTSLHALAAGDVVTFMVAQADRLSVSGTRRMGTSLRALLRWLRREGDLPADLAGAVPSAAARGGSTLPRSLPPGQVEAMLASFDRDTEIGARDYAMLMLLARLGLRRGAVAGLQLADIGWRAGEITIRSKGREQRFPLPADVGEALAHYIRHHRPRGQRAVFITVLVPRRPISPGVVCWVARQACLRAGYPESGPHRIRHTLACRLLAGGAPLAEISQLLGHLHLEATAIYAKAGRSALATVARPWPAGA